MHCGKWINRSNYFAGQHKNTQMSREAIEVGAFTWSRIQRLYDTDAVTHWQRCSEGLQCPQEVFTQLFHEAEEMRPTPAESADVRPGSSGMLNFGFLRSIDWGRVHWLLEELSGIALRHVRVDRGYQHALDEARDRATKFGIVDERQEVVDHWRDAKSWIVPPVIVDGDLLGGGSGLELLVGFTRLGNLLGMLDREDVPETKKHLVWVGRQAKVD
jgi:hypothetical protein